MPGKKFFKEVIKLRSRVEDAIELIGSNGWVKDLQAEQELSSRCEMLFELFPMIGECRMLVIRNHFLFEIGKAFGINLGICRFFWIDDEGRKQYCLYHCQHGDLRSECICEIPQSSCKVRGDRKKEQKTKALCFQ